MLDWFGNSYPVSGNNKGSSEDLIDLHRRHFLRSLAASPFAGAALSAEVGAASSREITVSQGGTEVATVVPYSHGMNVDKFYSYNGEYRGNQNSSANTPSDVELEQGGVSQLFFHEHDGTLSLVMIHDEPGANSGSHRVEFEGLPDSGSWTVKDDPTHAPDEYPADGSFAEWAWGSCCTDGGAYSWSDEGAVEFTVTPAAYSSRANAPFEGISTWKLRSGDGTSATLDKSQPVTVTVGESVPNDELETVMEEKMALAQSIDGISQNIEETARVEATLDDLQDGVDAGDFDVEEAIEAIERMKLGENVTESTLAALGPTKLGTQNPNTLVGSPIDDYDVAGEIASLALSLVVELALAGLAIARFLDIAPSGTLAAVTRTAKRKIDGVIDWVIKGLLGSLGPVVDDVMATADTLKKTLYSLISDVGESSGKVLAEELLKGVANAKDTIANSLVDHFETDKAGTNIDDKLYALNEKLDANGEIGPDFSGSLSDAEKAAEDGLLEIAVTCRTAEQKLGIAKGVLKLVAALSAIGGILIASIWASLVGGVFTVAGILTTIAINSMSLNAGYMSMERVLYEHNKAIDAVLNGNPDVPDATPDSS